MSTDYEKLAAHFDKTFKKPPHGLEYLTGEQVITRLNTELGWDAWTYEVVEHGYHLDSDSVWVKGRLTAGGVVKEQFGSQAHNRTRDGKIIDLGFDLKGAATDALKKCATLIGVGLYLSEKEGGQEAQKPAQAPEKPVSAPQKTMWDVLLEMGYERDFVIAECQRLFDNREPKALTKEERKRLIVHLEDMKKKNGAAA